MEQELRIMIKLDYDTYLALEPTDRSYRLMLELVKSPLYCRDWNGTETIYTKKKHGITCMVEPAMIRDEAPVVSDE